MVRLQQRTKQTRKEYCTSFSSADYKVGSFPTAKHMVDNKEVTSHPLQVSSASLLCRSSIKTTSTVIWGKPLLQSSNYSMIFMYFNSYDVSNVFLWIVCIHFVFLLAPLPRGEGCILLFPLCGFTWLPGSHWKNRSQRMARCQHRAMKGPGKEQSLHPLQVKRETPLTQTHPPQCTVHPCVPSMNMDIHQQVAL